MGTTRHGFDSMVADFMHIKHNFAKGEAEFMHIKHNFAKGEIIEVNYFMKFIENFKDPF